MTKGREQERLDEAERRVSEWKHWGPYLSERAWGTVREDYSPDGAAWEYFPFEQSHLKAYRWNEDGIAGICDRKQTLCFSIALWNGQDPILKERLFGLSGPEGNHGEDVREYYFYLDNTPTHSYMRMLYKYPHAESPQRRLLDAHAARAGGGEEFELLDTGIFDEDRYFDIFIEYAKSATDDICVRIEAVNRGPDAAALHLLPHLWFRNTWGWHKVRTLEPTIIVERAAAADGGLVLVADDRRAAHLPNLTFQYELGERRLYAPAGGQPLFTDNETNSVRLYGAHARNASPYTKDAFHRFIVNGERGAVNPNSTGTKACIDYATTIAGGGSHVWRFRLNAELLADPPVGGVAHV